MMNVFKVNGVVVTPPSSIKLSREKVWSQNTGRNSAGDWVGDILTRKVKLSLSWGYITENQLYELSQSLEGAYVEIYFKNPHTKSFETKTFYGSELSSSVLFYDDNGIARYDSASVNLIQK